MKYSFKLHFLFTRTVSEMVFFFVLIKKKKIYNNNLTKFHLNLLSEEVRKQKPLKSLFLDRSSIIEHLERFEKHTKTNSLNKWKKSVLEIYFKLKNVQKKKKKVLLLSSMCSIQSKHQILTKTVLHRLTSVSSKTLDYSISFKIFSLFI